MSFAEHLIENALATLERGGDFNAYANNPVNVKMAYDLRIDLKEIWGMACHVFYVFKPEWEAIE